MRCLKELTGGPGLVADRRAHPYKFRHRQGVESCVLACVRSLGLGMVNTIVAMATSPNPFLIICKPGGIGILLEWSE